MLLVTLQGSAGPRSLATTSGVSLDFLSSGYLDVSVPRVCSYSPMYSGISTCLTPLFARPKHRNNRMSGGFPHSDIHGSKPIPGSPWLNAGYHVLHRLLLPRHPPNALFALDLIQKEQDPSLELFLTLCLADIASRLQKQTTCQKLYTFPHHIPKDMTVSVLDLEQYRSNHLIRACSTNQIRCIPYSGASNDTDVFSLYDVNFV